MTPRRVCFVLLAWCTLLLAGASAAESVILSEFMADNRSGLVDEDGALSDWIEIQNTGTTTVDLAGWALTDDATDLGKWTFPTQNLAPGQFLLVFASNKNRRVAGAPLHTNFSLSATGEYLALVKPGGSVATEFAPQYPAQFADKSYGIGQNVVTTQLIGASAPLKAIVPVNGNLGAAWIQPAFNDATWTGGTNGAGYESTVPGFAVKNFKGTGTVGSLDEAESVIATPAKRSATYLENTAFINYLNSGGDGHYGSNATFPGLSFNVDSDNFVVEATGFVTIPAAGNWSFGVNSDDGFGLTVGSFSSSYFGLRGAADTIATFNFPAAGVYPIRLVFFEQGGGSALELFAAPGALDGWTSAFKLVGDTANGGLSIRSVANTAGGYRALIGTDLQSPMLGKNSTAYLRFPFSVASVADLSTLTLRLKYDDGFVAYINGTEVARRNAPATPTWNSAATGVHANASAIVFESFDAGAALPTLHNGSGNVLAIQMLNNGKDDPDVLALADLAQFKTTGSGFHYFTKATPGEINTNDYYAFVEQPQFSVPRGYYSAPFSVAISSATSGAAIRYTTDGSVPSTTNGTVYSGPVSIKGTTVLRAASFATGFEPSKISTVSYFFAAQVVHQPALPAGFPANWSANVVGDYEMDPSVVDDPTYSGVIQASLRSLPTVSIVMNMADFLGPNGIYSNSTGEGTAWERAASVEWIAPAGGGDEFQIDCGIRPQGGASRDPGTSPKHGFRLLFKSQYGASKLKFPLFPDSEVDEFDTVTLHARFNDAWVWGGSSAQYIRDLWCRDTQLAMGRLSPHGTYVHLYVNGVYWGMYDPGEKPDASFAAHHLGGDKADYDALNSGEVIDGDRDAWNTMFALAAAGLEKPENYAAIQQYLDVPGLIDYMIVNFYGGNTDWPYHNWTAARRRAAGAGYEFFSWDAEWTFAGNGTDVTSVNSGDSPAYLYSQLRANVEFRMLFADRVQKHFYNGGVLTPAAVDARWMKRATQIDQAVIAESARWGDYRGEPPFTRNNSWLVEQNRLRTQFFPQRTAIMVQQFRNAGLFPTLDAPVLSLPGGSVAVGSSLTLANPNGTGSILFTIDGSDPRLPGGAASPAAQTYAGPLTLNSHAFIRARVKDGSSWSALTEGTFYVQQDFAPLAVTEIMYNPPGNGAVSGDEYEFVELKNTGSNALDLSGLSFTSGLTFSFPAGTTLNPGQFFVLVRNAARFAERYPGVPIGGIYTGKLDNSGEQLALTHVLGTSALSVTYGDHAPWPVTADGNGFSLVPANASTRLDPDNAANWRASAAIYGSPGADDPTVTIPGILVNEVLTHTTSTQVDTVELYNPTGAPVNIGGWFLSDDGSAPKKYIIPANTVLPAGGYLSFDEAQFNPTPGVVPSFSLGADGDQIYLLSGNGVNLTGYSHGFSFGAAAEGVTFGRYLNSVGEEQFPAQLSRTFNGANAGPRVGPVVINEVMYHPEAGYDEFIELKNITAAAVPLFDPAHPENTWHLAGLGYALPANLTVPANGFLLLVGIDPATFRTKYQVPASTVIVGPYPGILKDSGELLALERPDVPLPASVPMITVDALRYHDQAPWPISADGSGPSLQRLNSSLYGNDPANWFASGPTPGLENVVNLEPTIILLTPNNGASYPAVATIVLEATASDSDGTVSKVEFFASGTKVGEATAPPYRFTWTGVSAGTYAITAKVRDNRLATTVTDPAIVTVTPPPVGLGLGLLGEYYDTVVNFSAPGVPFLKRTDAQVGFDWGSGSPDPRMGEDSFSVRWTGQVQPRTSGTYSFYTYSDDGVRLWVNGQQLVDNWTDHGPTENAGQITLEAGQLYDVRMEFYENGGGALATLSWSPPGEGKGLIPQSQLYPAGAPHIAGPPRSQAASVGGTAAFSVLASGTGPFTYQWLHAGTPVSGATAVGLTLSNVQAADAGSYSVVVTNSFGTITSAAATLTVNNPDTDGDGIPDAWETLHGLDPHNPADGALDSDGDGLSNRDEYLAGTDPRDPASSLKIEIRRNASGATLVRFTAVPNKAYTIEYASSVNATTWTKLADIPATAAAHVVEVSDPGAASITTRFYHVVTPQRP